MAIVLVAAGCHSSAHVVDAGCTPPDVVDTGNDAPRWFALDAQGFYWGTAGAIRSAPRCGGAARTIASTSASPSAIVVDSGVVYFASNTVPGSIGAARTDGSSPSILIAQRSFVTDLAIDAQSIYFLDGGALRQLSRAGGDATDLATGLDQPTGLAVSNGQIFWVNRGSEFSPGEVVTLALGGKPGVLAPGQPFVGGHVGALTLDDTTVYFAGWPSDLSSVPRSGGATTRILHDQSPTAVTVAGGHLYWINEVGDSSSSLEGLWRVPVSGGNAEPLDSHARGNSLSVDGGALFYLTSSGIARRPIL
jgi:hypothetical protein